MNCGKVHQIAYLTNNKKEIMHLQGQQIEMKTIIGHHYCKKKIIQKPFTHPYLQLYKKKTSVWHGIYRTWQLQQDHETMLSVGV